MAAALEQTDFTRNEPKDWVDYWETGKAIWHKAEVNPWLVKYIHLLENNRKNLRVFFPLCGKSVDMKWMIDRGHIVVGAEISSLAVESFFKENSYEYSVEVHNEIPKYTEKTGRVTLYCCNIFDFSKTGEKCFDAILDRGSFGAINPDERSRYLDIMSAIKTPECRHLIEVYEYDTSIRNNFPYSVPMSVIVELLGDKWNVELVETEEGMDIARKFSEQFKSFIRNIYLVTHK